MKIGILGNGQLGQMAALAAANLGIEVVIYAPDDQGPANIVVRESHVGAYDDEAALARFADSVDAITYEFENVPVAAAKFVENIKPIFPQPIWLERAQHRLKNITQEVREYYSNMKIHSDIIELRNISIVADLTVQCALKRKESRGIHYSLDFPPVNNPDEIDLVDQCTNAHDSILLRGLS